MPNISLTRCWEKKASVILVASGFSVGFVSKMTAGGAQLLWSDEYKLWFEIKYNCLPDLDTSFFWHSDKLVDV